jgi:hypothetical protein
MNAIKLHGKIINVRIWVSRMREINTFAKLNSVLYNAQFNCVCDGRLWPVLFGDKGMSGGCEPGAVRQPVTAVHLARRHRWPHCAAVFGATATRNDHYRIDDMPKVKLKDLIDVYSQLNTRH